MGFPNNQNRKKDSNNSVALTSVSSGITTNLTESNVSNYETLTIICFSDVNLAVNGLVVRTSNEGGDGAWKIIGRWTVFAGITLVKKCKNFQKFIKISFTTDYQAATQFSLDTFLEPSHSPETTTLGSEMVANYEQASFYGESLNVGLSPVFSFDYTDISNTSKIKKIKGSGGNILTIGKFIIFEAANSGDYGKITGLSGKIRAYDQSIICRFSAYFDAVPSGSNVNIGVATRQDGIGSAECGEFFAFNGGNFAICSISSIGSQTIISSSNWNVDRMDGTGPSGVTLDTTTMNIFQIKYSSSIFGNIYFYILNKLKNEFQLVHVIYRLGKNNFDHPTGSMLAFYAYLYSGGEYTKMYLHSASIFVEGSFPHIRHALKTFSYSCDKVISSSSSYAYLLTLSSVETNLNQAKLKKLSFSGIKTSTEDADSIVSLQILRDCTPNSASYSDVDSSSSIIKYDTSATGYSDGKILHTLNVTLGSSISQDLSDLGIFISPGTIITFVCKSSSGNGTFSLAVSWEED